MSQIKLQISQAAKLSGEGRWESAVALYEKIFRRSIANNHVEDLLEVTRRIGYAYQFAGDILLAVEYLELACTLADLHNHAGSAARALNGLATVYQHSGSMELAEEAYESGRLRALEAGDALAAGDIEQNLGTLATIRGDHRKALLHFQASREFYSAIGHQKGHAQVLSNIAMLHLNMGMLEEAEQSIEGALAICEQTGDSVSTASANLNRAEVQVRRRNFDRARASCDCAFEIAGSIDDNRLLAESLRCYGTIYRETSKPHLALVHLHQAISLSRTYSLPLTEAEALRELALVLRTQDQNAEALDAFNRAHVLFANVQARPEQADVSLRLAQLEEEFLSVVRDWGASIEEKDRYTRGHCQRVAEYACRLGRSVGISETDLVWFRMGAFLHDVGKMEIPEAILHKRGVLTATERRVVERHTINGDELLSAIPFPWDIRPMVRSHHERWDGRGYPDGLAGEEIPLAARILRLADVFDALTTSRSYRQSFTCEEARDLMREDTGAFDPTLFEHFERLFPEFAEMVATNIPDMWPQRDALLSDLNDVFQLAAPPYPPPPSS